MWYRGSGAHGDDSVNPGTVHVGVGPSRRTQTVAAGKKRARPRRPPLTPDQRADVVRLYGELGAGGAAARLGLPRTTVSSTASRAGVTRPSARTAAATAHAKLSRELARANAELEEIERVEHWLRSLWEAPSRCRSEENATR